MTDDLLDMLNGVCEWRCDWVDDVPPDMRRAPGKRVGVATMHVVVAAVRLRPGRWLRIGPRTGAFGSFVAQLRAKPQIVAAERLGEDGHYLYVRSDEDSA